MSKTIIKKNSLCDLTELKELVKLMKEEKIFSLKAGAIEIQLSQLAFVPDSQLVDIIKESKESEDIKKVVESLKTSKEDILQTSKDFENSLSETNKADPICGTYTEEELFRD